MNIVATFVGYVVLAAIALALLDRAWMAIVKKSLPCVLGFHRWTPWWVCTSGSSQHINSAMTVQKYCLRCEKTVYADAGWPTDKNGYVKDNWKCEREINKEKAEVSE